MPSSPPARTSTPVPQTASRSHSTRAPPLSPVPANSVGNPGDAATTLAHATLYAATTPPIAYPHQLSRRVQESAVHGPVPVHSARSRSAITPLLRRYPPTKRRLCPASPAAQLPLSPPQWRAYLDGHLPLRSPTGGAW